MGNSAKRDVRKIGRADRTKEALALRISGLSYREIGERLGGVDESNMRKIIVGAIRDIPLEEAAEVKVLEIARLDAMLLGIWQKAANGDTGAIDRAVRIMERRASFLGLDAPKSITADITNRPFVVALPEEDPEGKEDPVIDALSGLPNALGEGDGSDVP